MKLETAEKLAVFGSIELYKGYSGRGMYGEQTTAVVYDDIRHLLIAIAVCAYECEDWQEHDAFKFELEHLRFDAMGLGSIAY